jgi:hypothetical protein
MQDLTISVGWERNYCMLFSQRSSPAQTFAAPAQTFSVPNISIHQNFF